MTVVSYSLLMDLGVQGKHSLRTCFLPIYIALTVASSGIAAILLDGGRTSHSRFRIPIDITSESICSISAQSDIAKLIRMTKLIIWDEAPAQHRHCFEAVNRTLRDIQKD